MKLQLIVKFLGTDKPGLLSDIAGLVHDSNCNILDSRQAIYGKDLSLTMIIEGEQPDITRAECMIPMLCQRLDLLSMMKRTTQHEKLNLERLFDVEFSGVDTPGIIKEITGLFSQINATISAFRQKTYKSDSCDKELMRCKLVISVPHDTDIEEFERTLHARFDELQLTGKLKDTHGKEKDENVASWG